MKIIIFFNTLLGILRLTIKQITPDINEHLINSTEFQFCYLFISFLIQDHVLKIYEMKNLKNMLVLAIDLKIRCNFMCTKVLKKINFLILEINCFSVGLSCLKFL